MLTPHVRLAILSPFKSGTSFHSTEQMRQQCWGKDMRHGETLEGENTVQIVHRIAAVLRAFGNKGLLGITDLANATGLPKSTTH
ncbi:MAG: hypothetical protein E6J22_02135, partial [Chloroflexi bacterium]